MYNLLQLLRGILCTMLFRYGRHKQLSQFKIWEGYLIVSISNIINYFTQFNFCNIMIWRLVGILML